MATATTEGAPFTHTRTHACQGGRSRHCASPRVVAFSSSVSSAGSPGARACGTATTTDECARPDSPRSGKATRAILIAQLASQSQFEHSGVKCDEFRPAVVIDILKSYPFSAVESISPPKWW